MSHLVISQAVSWFTSLTSEAANDPINSELIDRPEANSELAKIQAVSLYINSLQVRKQFAPVIVNRYLKFTNTKGYSVLSYSGKEQWKYKSRLFNSF